MASAVPEILQVNLGCAALCETPHKPAQSSALQGYQSAQCRIGVAVPAGFHVASELISERRVSGNRNDQVIPAVEMVEFQLPFSALSVMEIPRDRVAGIGVEYGHLGVSGGVVGDAPFDGTVIFTVVSR